MEFYIKHAEGTEAFEANTQKYAREKARIFVKRRGLQGAELFAWIQVWKGDPAAGSENKFMSVQWEGWQHEAYL